MFIQFTFSFRFVLFVLLFADVDNDSFMQRCARLNWIKSKDNKFLILNESDEFQAQNLSIEEEKSHPGEAQRSIYTHFSEIPRLTFKNKSLCP